MRKIRRIIIHCSATPNGVPVKVQTIDEGHRLRKFKRTPEAIRSYNPGLKHIGYHWFIALDGTEFPGRHWTEIGAHVNGSNADSLGICMAGTDRFSAAQWRTLKTRLVAAMSQWPEAEVSGHRDHSPDLDGDGVIEPQEWIKICPGFDVAAFLRNGMSPLPKHLLGG